MKRKYYILLGLVAFLSFSCQSFWSDDQVGQYVRFSAMVDGYSRTKTTYTGEKTGTKELIEWDNGDPVTIFMLSREKENVGDFTWTNETYSISHEKGKNNEGAISRGTLVANGTPLVWQGIEETQTEYFHRFYSVYPDGCATQVTGNDDALQFNLPARQDGKVSGMKFAYMAAANVASKKSWAGPVELHYYPMVTTIYVTLRNVSEDENGDIDLNTVSIKSTGNIAGSYQAVLGTRDGETGFVVSGTSSLNIKEVSAPASGTLRKGDDPAVYALFLCPQTYNTADLQLLINDKVVVESLANNQNAVNVLKPYEKYNITVELTASGVANPPKIGNAEAQMIFALLLQFDHNTLWELLGDYFEEYFDFTCADPDLLNGIWNNKIKGAENLGLEQMYDELIKWFPDDKLNGLLDAIGSLTEIDLTGNGPRLTADTLDFSIFKNAKSIKIELRNESKAEKDGRCREIIFDGKNLPALETIEIVGQSSGNYNLTISNCHMLRQCDLRNRSGLKLNQLIVENCSPHPDLDFAYIRVSGDQGWGSFDFKRKGDTQKIILECGYYDMISWWPEIYGPWHPSYTDKI